MNGEGIGDGSRTKKPLSFVKRGNDWSAKGLSDDRLRPTINRIIRLASAGLIIEHVGADFLLRRISPLQDRDRLAWLYGCAADMMRLLSGLANNLSVFVHA